MHAYGAGHHSAVKENTQQTRTAKAFQGNQLQPTLSTNTTTDGSSGMSKNTPPYSTQVSSNPGSPSTHTRSRHANLAVSRQASKASTRDQSELFKLGSAGKILLHTQ